MPRTKEISVFVDESGSFNREDISSRYYLVCLVFHDQSVDLSENLAGFAAELANLGLPASHCIHAGPLIRREMDYRNMDRETRRLIFAKTMGFVRRANFSYRRFTIDKRFIQTTQGMHDALLQQLLTFLVAHAVEFNTYDKLKIYYDNGQSQITTILKEAFAPFSAKTDFVANVIPANYRLFQVADVLCTIELAKLKLETNTRLTDSEIAFFGSIQNLRKNYIKPLARKLWA